MKISELKTIIRMAINEAKSANTKQEYELYLNEVGEWYDYESDEWIIGGENRYDSTRGKYGVALRKFDPNAFMVGYREWLLEK
jgi:hypothetical protein